MGKVYVGDVGLKIEVLLQADIADASKVVFNVKKPDGTEVQWDAIIDDAAMGKVYYVTKAGDLDQAGVYELQPLVEFLDGSKLYGETVKFMVYDRYR